MKKEVKTMRYVMYGALCFVVFLFSLEMLLTVNARSSRKDELEQAVTMAVSTTMENLAKGDISDEDELEMEFKERLGELIHSDSEIEIEILAKDAQKGLLCVCVEEEFSYPGGKKGKLSTCKTAILDETVWEEEKEERQ